MRKIITVTPFNSWETANRTIRDVVRQLQLPETTEPPVTTHTTVVSTKVSSGGSGGGGSIPQSAPTILIGTHADRLTYVAVGANNLIWQESDRNSIAYYYNTTTGLWNYFEGMYDRTDAQVAALAATLGIADTGYLVRVTDVGEILRWSGSAFEHFEWVLGRSALATTNGVPYVVGSGTLGEIANNTSGAQKFLAQTSGGVPSWEVVSGGGSNTGLVLLGTYTASNVATLDLNTRNATGQSGALIQTDFDEYEISVHGIIPATNGAHLLMRVSTNTGTSFESGSVYAWTRFGFIRTTSGVGGSDADTTIQLRYYLPNSGNFNIYGRFQLSILSGKYPAIQGYSSGYDTVDAAIGGTIYNGVYAGTTAITSLQLLMSSGNISSGVVRIYGVFKL